MTGIELRDQICLLGARTTDELEADFQTEHIYSSMNRAIGEVNKLFPVENTVQLLHYPRRPAVFIKGITVHKGGEDTVFDASDIKSLAFAVSGTGNAMLSGEGAYASYEFKWLDATNLQVKRAFIDEVLAGYNGGWLKLTFKGEHSYMISDVSFYSETDSDLIEDVEPYSSWKGYDLSSAKYCGKNFLGFSSLPIRFRNADLNAPTDYYIEDSTVYLRRGQEGVYEVKYYRAPAKLGEGNLSNELDIDFRLHELVAPKAAYYIYAVLDPEAAKVCDIEYQKHLSIVMSTMPKVRTPKKFRDVRGW